MSRPLSQPPVWRELTGRHWSGPGFAGSIRAVFPNRGETVFIHLGGNKMIRISEVITILDAGNRRSPITLIPFLDEVERQGRMERITTQEEVKSYVVTRTGVYASPISSLTLLKRAQQGGSRRRIDEWYGPDPEKKELKE
ncbi:extracellular matrix regulator RemB [Kroppenstedtia eburnea]